MPKVWAEYEFSASNDDGVIIYYNIIENGTAVEVSHNGNASYSGDVVIPDSVLYGEKYYKVTSIGDKAFAYSKLTSLHLPQSLTHIKRFAFMATKLGAVSIPENVKSVEHNAFINCTSLNSVVWNAKNCISQGKVFENTGISSITFGDSVEYIPSYLCSGFEKLLTITIPSGVRSIGSNAFAECNGLKIMFYNGTLEDWYKMELENKESNPMSYAAREFIGNQELIGDLNVSKELTEIKNYTFAGCMGLTSITFPDGLESIGKGAFDGCESIESIYSYAAVPPAISDDSFSGISNAKLYVSCGDAEIAYLKSSWVVLDEIIGIEHWVTVMSSNEAMGTAELVQPVSCGTTVAQMEAIPNEGYRFVEWSDGNTENPRIVYDVTSDTTFVAEFALGASGVDVITQQGGFSVVSTDEGSLQVYGAADKEISVYNLQGMCMFRGIADEPTVISLPAGVYMVQAGNKTIKAINR